MPIRSAIERRDCAIVVDGWRRSGEPEQDDAAFRWQSGLEGELPEVSVAGKHEPLLQWCLREDGTVIDAWVVFGDPRHVVAATTQSRYYGTGHILIGENPKHACR